MRAVVATEFGGPGTVTVGEVDEPTVGPAGIEIEVRAASVNPADVKMVAGSFGEQSLPFVTGFDAAGVVTALGSEVTDLAVGDEVFGLGQGTHAERAVLSAAARKPAGWSFEQAAAAAVAGETAVRGLELLGVGPGTTVVIDGASGGVGTFAVQLAVARGATVIGSASAANHDFLASLGATPVQFGDGLANRVRAAAPNGVDAVFDVAGKSAIEELVSLVADPTQVLSIANFDAPRAGARVSGGGETDAHQALLTVAGQADGERALVVTVEQTLPFDRAAEAFTTVSGGHVRGKVVLVP